MKFYLKYEFMQNSVVVTFAAKFCNINDEALGELNFVHMAWSA